MRKITVLLIMVSILFPCKLLSQTKITGTRGKVIEVLDGNTIRIDKGIIVDMHGIDDNINGKKYLEQQVKGKEITLIADSKDPVQTYRSNQAKVKAYVRLVGRPGSLNGRMLASRISNFVVGSMTDSIVPYKKYVSSLERPKLSKTELLVKVKSASFRICTNSGTGTGFFISDDGLALTNNHVLDGSESATIYMFGEDGEINPYDARRVSQIIVTYPGQFVDFTIFRVELHSGEKTNYLPLVGQHVNDGEDVAKIGCPLGENAHYATGNLSNYKYDDDGCYLIHTIPTNPGDSGGPVVNFKGEAVGVNQSIRINQQFSSPGQGMAYAVDVVQIAKWLKCKGIVYGK